MAVQSQLYNLGVGGVPQHRVKNLGDDLMGLFGAVGKGVQTYDTIGETAANLEFKEKSQQVAEQIRLLNEASVGQDNNPEFWDGYNNHVESITAELVAEGDKFKNHKAAYNEYNNAAIEFATNIRGKYGQLSLDKQFSAIKNIETDKEGIFLGTLGTEVTPTIRKQSIERMSKYVTKYEAEAWVDDKIYGSLYSSMDAQINAMPPSYIQNIVTNDDGSYNQRGAINLLNTISNISITGADILETGEVKIFNASGDTKYDEATSLRLKKIESFYKEPTSEGYVNYDYAKFQSDIENNKINYKQEPSAVVSTFNSILHNIYADFEGTQGFKRLTGSERETYYKNKNTFFAEQAGYGRAYELYTSGAIKQYSNLADIEYQYVDINGNKSKAKISEDVISGLKEYDEAKTTEIIVSGKSQDPMREASAFFFRTGKELPFVTQVRQGTKYGIGYSSINQARTQIEFLSKQYDAGEYGKDEVIQRKITRANELFAKLDTKEVDEKYVLSQLNLDSATISKNALNIKHKEDANVIRALDSYANNTFGFNGQYNSGTVSYVNSKIKQYGGDWDIFTDSKRKDIVESLVATTVSNFDERVTSRNSYVVPRLKFKDGTPIGDNTMWNGVQGIIDKYNKDQKTSFGIDDFSFEGTENGTIRVKKVTGNNEVTLYPSLTAENMQYFSKLKTTKIKSRNNSKFGSPANKESYGYIF